MKIIKQILLLFLFLCIALPCSAEYYKQLYDSDCYVDIDSYMHKGNLQMAYFVCRNTENAKINGQIFLTEAVYYGWGSDNKLSISPSVFALPNGEEVTGNNYYFKRSKIQNYMGNMLVTQLSRMK